MPTVINELGRFDDLAAKHSFSIKLSAGEGYVINNRRWLHGRKEFSGEREFLRLLLSDRSPGHKGIVLRD
jgi:alpha-ketoglutarate-dependent taurine dioxygenase